MRKLQKYFFLNLICGGEDWSNNIPDKNFREINEVSIRDQDWRQSMFSLSLKFGFALYARLSPSTTEKIAISSFMYVGYLIFAKIIKSLN